MKVLKTSFVSSSGSQQHPFPTAAEAETKIEENWIEMAVSFNLLDELCNILRTYSQRLEVLERTFRDSGEDVAHSIA